MSVIAALGLGFGIAVLVSIPWYLARRDARAKGDADLARQAALAARDEMEEDLEATRTELAHAKSAHLREVEPLRAERDRLRAAIGDVIAGMPESDAAKELAWKMAERHGILPPDGES